MLRTLCMLWLAACASSTEQTIASLRDKASVVENAAFFTRYFTPEAEAPLPIVGNAFGDVARGAFEATLDLSDADDNDPPCTAQPFRFSVQFTVVFYDSDNALLATAYENRWNCDGVQLDSSIGDALLPPSDDHYVVALGDAFGFPPSALGLENPR